MKVSARSILSATVGLGLATFTVVSLFTAVSASVPATALGLLAIYGIMEMMIRSYAPRRLLPLRSRAVRVVAPELPVTVVRVPALVEFPSRVCAA